MNYPTSERLPHPQSRRDFLTAAVGVSGLPLLATAADSPAPAPAPVAVEPPHFERKIKIGLIGAGGRGRWIAGLMKKHGGFEIAGIADYFAETAQVGAKELGVPENRVFDGLSGYKRLLDSGVEAVAIEDVPYFYPEQAKTAVEAGKHVYMAKPVAVDVPGCLTIGAAGKLATQKNLCLLVDYQLPTDPAMIEIGQRVRDGALGSLTHLTSFGIAWHAWPDPPLGPNIEDRLRKQIWLSDTALSGDTIVSYDIHIIDALIWLLGQRPVAACGRSRTCRPEPHGDRTDTAAVIFEFKGGEVWTHVTQSIDNNPDITTLSASVFGTTATARVQYSGKVYVRGGPKQYAGTIGSVFNQGVERNIAEFYRCVTDRKFENPSVQRAVDGTLTAILGREAAARRTWLTMDDLIRENKALVTNLTGMKV